jgi:hypothetical protein
MSLENWIQLENFFPAYSIPDSENLPEMFKYYENNNYYITNNLKKEFTALKLDKVEKKPPKGTPLKNQDFARKYMHPVTPYDKLLIFQGLGTGKTCLSVFVYEFARKFFLQDSVDPANVKKALVIVRGPNSKKNFIRELANVCTTGDYIPKNDEIRQKDTDEKKYVKLSPEKRYLRTLRLVRKHYEIETFIKFATELSKMSDERIRKMFSNTYIIIDEVHNLRYQPKKATVSLYEQYYRLLHLAENSKILLLSATPMRDQPEEIVSILNLLLPKDKNMDINMFKSKFLNSDGMLLRKKSRELSSLFKGHISYVRSMESTAKRIFVGQIVKPMKYIFTTTHEMSDFQRKEYMKAWNKEKEKDEDDISSISDADDDDEDEQGEKQGLYEKSRQASLFVFPDGTYGSDGLNNWVTIDKKNLAHLKPKFQAELVKYGNTLEQKLKALSELSYKYAYIIKEILDHPDEKIFIYSSFVRGGGAILIGALLEFFGFSHIETERLFKSSILEDEETIEEKSLDIQQDENVISKLTPNSSRFCVITGTNLSPAISDNLINRVYNDKENTKGEYLRIIIGSHVVGEGLSFKCVRQMHVVTPHWNNSVTEQAIGRGIRAFSHDDLPVDQRYIKIYRHVSLPANNKDSIDLKMYKLSEDKDIKIKAIERVMKESAVDCINNRERNIRTDIDKDGSRACDYNICDYDCLFADEDEINQMKAIEDTNNLYYADGDVEYIIAKLREVFYEKDSIDLEDILHLFYDKTTFVVLRSLKKIIDENIPIKTKTANTNYLREYKNLYFLVSNIELPNSFLLSGYAGLPLFKIEKDLKEIVSVKEPEVVSKLIDEINNSDYDENIDDPDGKDILKRVHFIFRKLLSNETREMFLEQFYIAQRRKIEKNKILREKFMSFYGNYLVEVDDNIYSFYNYRFGGVLRYYNRETKQWENSTDEMIEEFEEARKEKRTDLDKNKFGYYAILAEKQSSDVDMATEIGVFKYKIFMIKTDYNIAEATGKIDKRKYREFNPGTECGTGNIFNKQGLIKMMSGIFAKLLKSKKRVPAVPLLGSAKTKRTLSNLKNHSNYSNLHEDARKYLDKLDNLEDDVPDEVIQSFSNLLDTSKTALCSFSREWFQENDLVYYY